MRLDAELSLWVMGWAGCQPQHSETSRIITLHRRTRSARRDYKCLYPSSAVRPNFPIECRARTVKTTSNVHVSIDDYRLSFGRGSGNLCIIRSNFQRLIHTLSD